MALVRLGGGAEARGSIGGITYSRNRGGAYMRARVKPVNPATDRQVQVRAGLTMAVNAWRTLAADVRDAWDVYATNVPVVNKLGETTRLTGQQCFIRQYVVSQQAGVLPVLASAPGIFNRGDPAIITNLAVNEPGSIVAQLPTQAWAGQAGSFLSVWLSRPQNGSRRYVRTGFAYAGTVLGASTAPTAIDMVTPYQLVEGQLVAVRTAVRYTDGRYSSPVDQIVAVTAI